LRWPRSGRRNLARIFDLAHTLCAMEALGQVISRAGDAFPCPVYDSEPDLRKRRDVIAKSLDHLLYNIRIGPAFSGVEFRSCPLTSLP
jgi:hypothetical protein